VADLAGPAGCTAREIAVDDDTGADATVELEVDEVRAVPAGAPCELRQRRDVRVVVTAETVEFESPAARASSARLIAPRSRSRTSMRCGVFGIARA
jgi:hypothetical protein